MIPTRTAAAHMGLAHHRCPLMSRVHPRASGADPPKWLGADRRDHRLPLPLSTCLSLPADAWPANFEAEPQTLFSLERSHAGRVGRQNVEAGTRQTTGQTAC